MSGVGGVDGFILFMSLLLQNMVPWKVVNFMIVWVTALQVGYCSGSSSCRMVFNFKSCALLQWISQVVQSSWKNV